MSAYEIQSHQARPLASQTLSRAIDTIAAISERTGLPPALDKLPGQRAVESSSRVGGRKPVCSTGVGKALLLDKSEQEWRGRSAHDAGRLTGMSESEWVALMRRYAQAGYAYDLGEDAGAIRCVAAPIRDASTGIVAAISVSSAVEYMGDERMKTLIPVVKRIAQDISADLGARKPAP